MSYAALAFCMFIGPILVAYTMTRPTPTDAEIADFYSFESHVAGALDLANGDSA